MQGVQPRYYLGDQLTATCSTDPAYPEPVMKWWINGHAADTKHVTRSGLYKAGPSFLFLNFFYISILKAKIEELRFLK
jgi:hypothetical protein